MTEFRDNQVLRTKRAFVASGISDGVAYTFPAGTLCTVVTPGEGWCHAEFVVTFPDGGVECALVTIEEGEAEIVPRSEWESLAAE